RADELFQLIPPMRRNRRVGVEGKAVHTGTARTGQPWRLALSAKARADAAHLLAGSFTPSDAVLNRRRQGPSELRCGVAQGVIPGGHGGLQARLQVAQGAQLTDNPSTDLLDHVGDVGIGRWLACEKAGFATCVGALKVDPLQEDAMAMKVHIERAAKALEKRDRARVDVRPLMTLGD